jgi:hypothetical protein
MHVNDRGSRGPRLAKRLRLPLDKPLDLACALFWREQRRKAVAKQAPPPAKAAQTRAEVNGHDRARRAKFAENIARAEFGRAYWDERRQRGVDAHKRTEKPRKPPPKKTGK